MAILATYPLHTSERKNYSADYTKWLGVGDLLDSATVSVTPVTSPPLPATVSVDVATNTVKVVVGPGGVDGQEYDVQITAVTVGSPTCGSEIKVDCLVFIVKDGC